MIEPPNVTIRNANNGLRKLCDCHRRKWAKCAHPWYFNYKPRGAKAWRFSIDAEIGRPVKGKTEAETLANDYRAQINAGTFVRAADRRNLPAQQIPEEIVVTIESLGDRYFREYRNAKTSALLSQNERYRWDLIMRTEIERIDGSRVRFGALDVRRVTRHDIEAFKAVHIVPRVETFADAKGRTHQWKRGGPVGVNRCLGRLRSFYSWAIKQDHVTETPFKKGGETVIEFFGESNRERRLEPQRHQTAAEEERIFAAANPHLQALMVAAIETGCRVGELLSLQWRQVRWDLNEVHLPAKKTKALRRRELPMSQRLRALLTMRRTDPTGTEYEPDHYVFGNVDGSQVKSIRTAWENAVLKAHGVEVKRTKTAALVPECREALQRIDLHFHDLRREAGSRFLEHGMPPHYVQAFLDHANLSTTSRYLNITAQGMHTALQRVEQSRRAGEQTPARAEAVTSTTVQ